MSKFFVPLILLIFSLSLVLMDKLPNKEGKKPTYTRIHLMFAIRCVMFILVFDVIHA